jgi:hypothetical protein
MIKKKARVNKKLKLKPLKFKKKRKGDGISESVMRMLNMQDSFSSNRAIPSNFYEPDMRTSYYRTIDSDEFPIGSYIENKTGRPITHFYKPASTNTRELCHFIEDVDNLLKQFPFQNIFSFESWDPDESSIKSSCVYEWKVDDGIILLLVSNYPKQYKNKKIKKRITISLTLASNAPEATFNQVRDYIIDSYKKAPVPNNNVNLVIAGPGGYDTETFDLPKQVIDIQLNYGTAFLPIHETILSKLNKQKGKGLVLLHGDPGTGKTHYLKYLASRIRNKRVLFIPPFLADFITSPDMVPFLIDNSNSILFIEDAERVITDRTENGSTGVSNILNITDGILSDILNIQIVATFNMDKKKIDPALLRKGRLIAEHKFEALSVEDSNRLLKHLGINHTTDKPMTLTEIYNHKDKHHVSDENNGQRRRIGFGAN